MEQSPLPIPRRNQAFRHLDFFRLLASRAVRKDISLTSSHLFITIVLRKQYSIFLGKRFNAQTVIYSWSQLLRCSASPLLLFRNFLPTQYLNTILNILLGFP